MDDVQNKAYFQSLYNDLEIGNLDGVLDKIEQYGSEKNVSVEVATLRANFYRIQHDFQIGLLTRNEYDSKLNKLTLALAQIIYELKEEKKPPANTRQDNSPKTKAGLLIGLGTFLGVFLIITVVWRHGQFYPEHSVLSPTTPDSIYDVIDSSNEQNTFYPEEDTVKAKPQDTGKIIPSPITPLDSVKEEPVKPAKKLFTVMGSVSDQDGMPLSGVNVRCVSPRKSSQVSESDSSGVFSIEIEAKSSAENIELVFVKEGYSHFKDEYHIYEEIKVTLNFIQHE